MPDTLHLFLDSVSAMDALAHAPGTVHVLGSRRTTLELPDGTIEQWENPWQFIQQDERAESSYRLARAVVGPAARWMHTDVADAIVHDWMYYCGEDLMAALFAARAILLAFPDCGRLAVHAQRENLNQRFTAEILRRARPDISIHLVTPSQSSEPPTGHRSPRPRPPARPTKTDVLLVELYANRLPHLYRTARATGRSDAGIAVLNMATRDDEFRKIAEFCAAHDLPWLDWRACIATPKGVRAASAAASAIAHASRLAPSASATAAAHLHVPLPGWAVAAIHSALLKSVVRMHAVRGVLRSAFTDVMPRVVLSARSDDTIMRVMGRVASDVGVTYLDLQHGIRNGSPSPLLRDIHGVELCLAGETTVTRYMDAGADPRTLHRTGTPFYDHLADTSVFDVPVGVGDRRFVVYSSALVRIHKRYLPELPHLRVLQGLDDFLGRVPGACVLIKPHPQELAADTERALATMAHADRVFIVPGVPNAPLFRRACAHVSIGSTTSLEAALLGVRAVMMTEGDASRSFDDAINAGAIIRVDSPDALAAALHELVADELVSCSTRGVDEIDRLYAFGLDGRASERIASLPIVKTALERR